MAGSSMGGANMTSGGMASTGGASDSTGGAGSGGAPSSGTVLFDVDFQERTIGTYTQEMVEEDFGFAVTWNDGLDEGRVSIVEEAEDKFLRVTYPGGSYGPADAGVQFKVPFDRAYQELYFRYRVRFRADFDFVKGGKLPGLIGGSAPTGCSPAPDGFSARNMWRAGGQAVQYVYHPPQAESCGDDLDYRDGGMNVVFAAGIWHTVIHRIVMNDKGSTNVSCKPGWTECSSSTIRRASGLSRTTPMETASTACTSVPSSVVATRAGRRPASRWPTSTIWVWLRVLSPTERVAQETSPTEVHDTDASAATT